MATRFTLPHIDISRLKSAAEYTGEGAGRSNTVREREAHGALLERAFAAAVAMIDAQRVVDERLEPPQGGYVEVALKRGTDPNSLERKTLSVRPGAVKDAGAERVVALYVPDEARGALASILDDYRHGELTQKGNPPNKALVESIETFRLARLETLWTDESAIPTDPQHEMWWSLWIPRTREAELETVLQRLDLRAAGRGRRLYFPEAAVVPVYASRAAIELLMFATGILLEIRRATDHPAIYLDETRDRQTLRADDLARRILWPGNEVPAVCVLDTGVNRAHALLEPILATDDLHAIDDDWGTDDHDDHGTAMAGMAAHGDLTAALGDTAERVMIHRLESVKILHPHGADPNDPQSYGAITQAAVSLPEIRQPNRARVYCMAVTNDGVSGARPSPWSAAIDQAVAGTMPGDNENSPKRLFVVSIGNTASVMQMGDWLGHDAYPAEDPSQAWNALTIGGYTDLDQISGKGYENWTCFADAGDLSPYSRTSVGWAPRRAPIKPELVLEAGNRAISPSRREVITLESLGVLTTGRDVSRDPLVAFQATSAATAEAARMAARLSAAFPNYWPETIRALMIHSAEYTAPMQAAFAAEPQLRNRYPIVRRFGYGVPDLDRASASARDHLALIAQSEIQPYRLKGRRYKECHYYRLPLPDDILADLGNETVQLKIALSYFVEPSPGFSANVDPLRYQSHGLRFDLRRRGETITNFKKRVNKAEREGSHVAPHQPDDNGWLLGADSVSAGSLHCDTWTGPAVNLLGRDMLCIKPVGGWWRDRAAADLVNQKTRYALIVTLKAARTDIDFYTPISLSVGTLVQVGGEVAIPT